jgi:drug/metabolite transporter (DMT)-like permease
MAMKEERRARLLIVVGAVLAFAGIVLAVGDDDTGRWLIVAGVVTLFVALHRFGRLGPGALSA